MNKKLKDSIADASVSLTDISFSISYTKANKLITALYMVTDIIDKDEPIRHKLRTLGTEIISDIHSIPTKANAKIAEIMSFLNIALAMNFISEMNCSILHKEFFELKGSIQKHTDKKPAWLTEFLTESKSIGHIENSNGHQIRTRIGVQKGSTLLNAIKRVSDSVPASYHSVGFHSESLKTSRTQDFDLLKKQRREDIIAIIKNNGGNATIKDIREKINGNSNGSLACSEKTLQRELVSMTKDGVLNKTGEKRWSKYFIK